MQKCNSFAFMLLLLTPYSLEMPTSPLWPPCQCLLPQTQRQAWRIQPGRIFRVGFVVIKENLFSEVQQLFSVQLNCCAIPVNGLKWHAISEKHGWHHHQCTNKSLICTKATYQRNKIGIIVGAHKLLIHLKATYSSAVTFVSAVIDLRTGGLRQPWENWEL